MLLKIIFFLTGFTLMVIGLTYICIYLNLLTIGYNFFSYVNFIIERIECWYFLIGIILILCSIFLIGRKSK